MVSDPHEVRFRKHENQSERTTYQCGITMRRYCCGSGLPAFQAILPRFISRIH